MHDLDNKLSVMTMLIFLNMQKEIGESFLQKLAGNI